jgi:hypothetical protein
MGVAVGRQKKTVITIIHKHDAILIGLDKPNNASDGANRMVSQEGLVLFFVRHGMANRGRAGG